MEQLLERRQKAEKRLRKEKLNSRVRITVGSATCENAAGANDVFKRVEELIKKHALKDVTLSRVGCTGKCDMEPVVTVFSRQSTPVKYITMTPDKVDKVFDAHILKDAPLRDLAMPNDGKVDTPFAEETLWADARLADRFSSVFGDVHFFGKQMRVTLRNCGVIDPEDMDEYLVVRGYQAAVKVLTEMTPNDVVNAVTKSGLRGRGGGGFPTGVKWNFALAQKSEEKYIICNADEGDPGAFMDRSTIEGDPHTVIEGMIIGGYAIGARQGYVYIRAEYPLAIKRLEIAIAAARQAGFLGKKIFGTEWDFDIEIRLGAGAFVCGEETALIRSIEGERGMPRPRPPYPAASGLWGKPTVINNVETFANIPVVILDGPEWFASIGTAKSKGTKVFALAGKVCNTGLVEVPMGTTLRDVVYGVGGGIRDGKKFKAVQTGGPAGGCLPDSCLDTPVDYESLTAAGSMMGSGGMIVIDEDSCMVDVARFFLDFTQDESCGKCTPCREGTKRMLEILQRITTGKGVEGDIEKLLRLGDTIKRTSLCGLGQASPNPVISTIKHFRDEYEAHIRGKTCPAGVCASLLSYTIIPEKCIGCGACKRKCPVPCISGKPKEVHEIDQARCIKCGQCFEACKFDAVKRK
jgi:NADH:ubiquinone oxidoreductase subunit F (NADH-binding)/(2Fe-2S) ferredoxin